MSLNVALNKDSIQINRKISIDKKDKVNLNTIEIIKETSVNSKIQYITNTIYKLSNSIYIGNMLKNLKIYDEYTFEHSIHVAIIASLLGMDIGVSTRELKNLATGAILHDIGKQLIPIQILNKQGRLTEYEFNIIKQHPQLGYNLIKNNRYLEVREKEIVYQHHENYNGIGYPRQLTGDDIDDLAMLVHICDVYDALVSKRSYKEPFTVDQALGIINEGRNILYNPEILDLFNKYIGYYIY